MQKVLATVSAAAESRQRRLDPSVVQRVGRTVRPTPYACLSRSEDISEYPLKVKTRPRVVAYLSAQTPPFEQISRCRVLRF